MQYLKVYKKIATNLKCHYFDFNEFITPSDLDGLHYDKNSHILIAQKLISFIKDNVL